jgi:hypothetical protein
MCKLIDFGLRSETWSIIIGILLLLYIPAVLVLSVLFDLGSREKQPDGGFAFDVLFLLSSQTRTWLVPPSVHLGKS